MKYNFILILFLAISITSCRKDIPDVISPKDYFRNSNYDDIFDAYWNSMNNNYVFWDIDTINWDKVYYKYKPLFDSIDVNNPQDKYTAYNYFKEMTANIIDSHYTLIFDSNELPNIRPSQERKMLDPDYHEPIDSTIFYQTIPNKYLLKSSSKGKNSDIGITVVSGLTNENILYLYFSAFSLTELNNLPQNDPANKALQYFFNQVTNNLNIKGIILDVRGNGGGSLSDMNLLIGSMISEPLYFGYTRLKGGNGRLDYSPWMPAFVTPQTGAKGITAPIVILADSQSVSMSEMTTMAVLALPNGHFIGERTWGANGPLNINEVFDDGQFKSPFFQLVYTSSLMLKDNNGVNHEGVGISPDIEVKYNQQALDQGTDPQLERALQFINNGN